MSDVGVHAEGLVATITGLTISEICADLTTFVNGRMLEDDGTVLLRYEEGAKGVLWATQVAIGDTSGLRIRVYGDGGTLSWRRSDPNRLSVFNQEGEEEIRTCPPSDVEDATPDVLLPPGHPEVHVAPLARLYRSFAQAVIKSIDEGKTPPPEARGFPGVREGIRSAHFTAAAVASSTSKEKWVSV